MTLIMKIFEVLDLWSYSSNHEIFEALDLWSMTQIKMDLTKMIE